MKESLQTTQSLSQNQTLAPLQVQFVRLLEMGAAAIEEEVGRRIDENPAIEIDDDSEGIVAENVDDDMSDGSDSDDYSDNSDAQIAYAAANGKNAAPIEINSADVDMPASLRTQLGELPLDAKTAALAAYIIDSLDDNGWLERSPAAMARDISEYSDDYVLPADMQRALEVVRGLDPAGIGASDLRECLLLQLDRRPSSLAVRTAKEIVDEHFELLRMRHFDKLKSRLGIDDDLLKDAMRVIRSLNPKPGNSQAAPMARHAMQISPDFRVEADDNGRLVVTLNEHVPHLVLSQSFDPQSPSLISSRDKNALAFMRSRGREATEFIDLLKRRSQTLLDIMGAIVKIQADFFRTDDPLTIKPMILKDVADITGKDISVISRATSTKYVATDRGIYPVKMLFNESSGDNGDQSAMTIIHKIKQLIDNEDKKRPLSDDAIVDVLKNQGFEIARRTVAKYREQAGIPNSRGRRGV